MVITMNYLKLLCIADGILALLFVLGISLSLILERVTDGLDLVSPTPPTPTGAPCGCLNIDIAYR